MKKRIWLVLFAFVSALCLCFGLAACGEGNGGGGGHTHSFTDYVYNNDATCTKNGTETAKCDGCEQTDTREKANSALGHECTVENKCSVCGADWEYTEGLDYELDEQTNTYIVTGIGTSSGDIVIPYGYQGKYVTSIGERAFYDCSNLTNITIPSSVTSIGNEAFRNCSSLTSITIPDSVTSIGNSVFRNCSGLESIAVASGNTAYKSEQNCLIERTSNALISGCKNSKIPDSVASIGDYVFNRIRDTAKNQKILLKQSLSRA